MIFITLLPKIESRLKKWRKKLNIKT
jgi:hypothetical protein